MRRARIGFWFVHWCECLRPKTPLRLARAGRGGVVVLFCVNLSAVNGLHFSKAANQSFWAKSAFAKSDDNFGVLEVVSERWLVVANVADGAKHLDGREALASDGSHTGGFFGGSDGVFHLDLWICCELLPH